jgi:hypothetical protein
MIRIHVFAITIKRTFEDPTSTVMIIWNAKKWDKVDAMTFTVQTHITKLNNFIIRVAIKANFVKNMKIQEKMLLILIMSQLSNLGAHMGNSVHSLMTSLKCPFN